jgi:putative phosphoribosyl transferase
MLSERSVAGEDLARTLAQAADRTGNVVVGIPKGGAIVGAQVALHLGLAYECVPVCRIGMPCFPDFTLGAIDPDGVATFEAKTQLTRYELTKSRGELAALLDAHVERCRGDRSPVELAERDLIVVDDAAETYVVAQAAAEYLRRHGSARLVFATPVASNDVISGLQEFYDEVVVGKAVPRSSLAGFYTQGLPNDDEIHECMVRAWDASPEKTTL